MCQFEDFLWLEIQLLECDCFANFPIGSKYVFTFEKSRRFNPFEFAPGKIRCPPADAESKLDSTLQIVDLDCEDAKSSGDLFIKDFFLIAFFSKEI